MRKTKKTKILSLLLVFVLLLAFFRVGQSVWAQEVSESAVGTAETQGNDITPIPLESTTVETDATSQTVVTEALNQSNATGTTSGASGKASDAASAPSIQPIMPFAVSDWMPDPNLRQAIAATLGIAEADLTQAEMLNLTNLYLSASSDMDLTGLEYATNLTDLGIAGNFVERVTNLNLASFQSLTNLSLNYIKVDSLNLTAASNLESASIYNVIINTLTVANHPHLRDLSLYIPSGLTSLDISNLPQLQGMSISVPSLTELTLQALPLLSYITLRDNKLTTFTATDLPELSSISFDGSSTLSSIILKNLPLLSYVYSGLNSLQSLTLQNLTSLSNLDVINSQIAALNIANLPNLYSVNLYNNSLLTTLAVHDLPLLSQLLVNESRGLRAITTNNLPELRYLYLQNNGFETLTLNGYPNLNVVYLNENQLTSVNISDLPQLNYLDVSDNHISDLRNLQLSSLPSSANISAYNQTFGESIRVLINQPIDLVNLYDSTGMSIPWVAPGTAGVDYTLNSPSNIIWLTGGFKTITANYNDGQLNYSAILIHTVLDPDAEGWTLMDGLYGEVDDIIRNSFTRGNFSYRVISGVTSVGSANAVTLNENQKITNLNSGAEYTYTYRLGNGVYSNVRSLQGSSYLNIMNTIIPKIYIRVNADGSEEMKRVDENTAQGFRVETITSVTQNGEIRHKVTLTNISGADMVDVEPLLHIDTELNSNDAISIYATGGGGVYMEAGGITMFGEPLEGTSLVYGGQYNTILKSNFQNETNVRSAWGRSNGDVLAENVDSAMYFGPSPVALLANGESISFSYQERIFTQDEPVPPPVNSIQVRYVNEVGDLLDEEFLQGSPGDSFTTTAKSFANYDLLRTEGPTSGTFTFEPQVVTYIYGLKAGGNVTVRYVDQDGQPLTPDIILTGQVTTTFATLKKVFPGYTFVRVEGSEQGVFTTEEQLVTYFYQKNTDSVVGDVLVRYLNQNGNPLTADIIIPGGQIGAAFSTEQKSFTGYDFVRVEGPTQGTFTQDPQTVTYYYKAQNVVKTGESHRPIEAGFFVLGLASMLVLGSYLWRRKQQSSDS